MKKQKTLTTRKGSLNPTSKLTEAQVLDIRLKYNAGGTSHRALANEFGVGKATITRVLSGKNWGWLGNPEERPVLSAKPAALQTADPEEWLANNETFYCQALRARITEATCRQNYKLAIEASAPPGRSNLLGHPFYKSEAKERLYHCCECPHGRMITAGETGKKARKRV